VNSYYICGIMVANKEQGVEPLELAADRAMRGEQRVLRAGPEGRTLYEK